MRLLEVKRGLGLWYLAFEVNEIRLNSTQELKAKNPGPTLLANYFILREYFQP